MGDRFDIFIQRFIDQEIKLEFLKWDEWCKQAGTDLFEIRAQRVSQNAIVTSDMWEVTSFFNPKKQKNKKTKNTHIKYKLISIL